MITVAPFDPELSRALHGPDWLRARRAEALERATAAGMPTTEDEVWRYSRIDELDVARFTPVLPAADLPPDDGSLSDLHQQVVAAIGETAGVVVIRNGRLAACHLSPDAVARGLTVGALGDHPTDTELPLMARPATGDTVVDLNTAYSEPVVVRVPRGVVIEPPLLVLQWIDAELAAVFPRLVLAGGEASQLTVIEHVASADVEALSVPVVELDVADGAVVRYLTAQQLGHRVWQLGHQAGRVGRNASLSSANVALGGDYARSRVDVEMAGEGGNADLVAVYFSDGRQTHDFRTLQDHHGRRTTSDLSFKGAVAGEAHAVYTGLIRVNPGAAGTSAFLTNRNVVLSEHARVDSVPNLDIINENDLRNCGHASASGPIDTDQLFYLESRGVPTETAKRLVVLGFFDDVLARTPVPSLRALLRQAVATKLDRVTP
ncbi:MAG TPA: SufD family Fe-S cluster assembly protein [Acidimicrobiales bacterium]|nr:SufD family Fe-S cluster assembly protein [Acidimicrobiales bacterium]